MLAIILLASFATILIQPIHCDGYFLSISSSCMNYFSYLSIYEECNWKYEFPWRLISAADLSSWRSIVLLHVAGKLFVSICKQKFYF